MHIFVHKYLTNISPLFCNLYYTHLPTISYVHLIVHKCLCSIKMFIEFASPHRVKVQTRLQTPLITEHGDLISRNKVQLHLNLNLPSTLAVSFQVIYE